PMYILDEVDAALDLSHTQNIGQLLRTRFKGSQFIVISLKEELFNNANVLFIARFRDGTSIVEQELLDKIKQQEAEIIKLTQKIEQLKTLTPQGLVNRLNAYEGENEKLKNQLE
ncbi:9658_t:CDS:2, partial [Entrophospora sp. SA101]